MEKCPERFGPVQELPAQQAYVAVEHLQPYCDLGGKQTQNTTQNSNRKMISLTIFILIPCGNGSVSDILG